MWTEKTTLELQVQMHQLATAKFKPPYLEEEVRRGIDNLIVEIYEELQSRKTK